MPFFACATFTCYLFYISPTWLHFTYVTYIISECRLEDSASISTFFSCLLVWLKGLSRELHAPYLQDYGIRIRPVCIQYCLKGWSSHHQSQSSHECGYERWRMEHCAHTNYVVLICEPDNFVVYVEFWRSYLRATPLHCFMCYLFACPSFVKTILDAQPRP